MAVRDVRLEASARRGRRARSRAHAHRGRERVARLELAALPEDEVRGLSDIFRALGEPTRIRILRALEAGELCVYELSANLHMSPSAISHQLRLLRALRLVRNRKQGREVYYALDDEHVVRLMGEMLSHLRHDR